MPESSSYLSQAIAMLEPARNASAEGRPAHDDSDERDKPSALFRGEESSSVPDTATGSPPWLTDSSSVDDLGWMIPVVIVCIFAMIGLAFACYFGIRRLELRMLNWCRVNCPCCCSPDEESGSLLAGNSYDSRSGTSRKDTVRLRDFRERAPSYGVTRDRHEEYVPRKDFNPFDDD